MHTHTVTREAAPRIGRSFSAKGLALSLGLFVVAVVSAALFAADVITLGPNTKIIGPVAILLLSGLAAAAVPMFAFPYGCVACGGRRLTAYEAKFPLTAFRRVSQTLILPSPSAVANLERERLYFNAKEQATLKLRCCDQCQAVAVGWVEAQRWEGGDYRVVSRSAEFELFDANVRTALSVVGSGAATIKSNSVGSVR